MRPETTIREAWLNFANAGIPQGAHPSQYKAMETAFYGGALSLFEMMQRAVQDNVDDDPTPDEVCTVARLYRELDEWGRKNLGTGHE